MFTINEVLQAHAKVKSGVDFPGYIRELIALGVKSYDTFVIDGHSEYFGQSHKIQSVPKYPNLEVTPESKPGKFLDYLKSHQLGQTDYPTFCRHSAETGIERWSVDMAEMTCTYYDKAGTKILVEKIPG